MEGRTEDGLRTPTAVSIPIIRVQQQQCRSVHQGADIPGTRYDVVVLLNINMNNSGAGRFAESSVHP